MANHIPAADAATSDAIVTYWETADRQSDMDVRGMTARDALALLLDQCGEPEQREAVLAGRFEVDDTATFTASERDDVWTLTDPEGGIWWPADEATDGASEEAVRVAYNRSPMSGTWRS